MSTPGEQLIPPMSASEMYQEETFTDRKVGSIHRLTPVTAQGEVDASRPMKFVGHTQLLTAMGSLPLSFEIAAQSLAEAIENFPAAANHAVEDTLRELQEMRREAASSIVIPEPGTGGGFDVPGKGKIQLR